MLQPVQKADVVVVGAGVAGLSAALRLTAAGVSTAVLEAAPFVGGRMSTEKVDGFRLDRIGQLLFTSYTELCTTPGLDDLVLRPFAPGVLVHSAGRRHHAGGPEGVPRGAWEARTAQAGAREGSRTGPTTGGDAWRNVSSAVPASLLTPVTVPPLPGAAVPVPGRARARAGTAAAIRIAGLRARGPRPGRLRPRPRSRAAAPPGPLGGAGERARLDSALAGIAATPVERLLARAEVPAAEALAARGVPARTAEGFLRPLLASLLCDPELVGSSRCADLALRAWATGRLCVPEGGAEVVPELLARALPPGTVHTGVRVTSVSTTSVTTAGHGEFRCRAVLLATGARAAAELLPGLRVPDFHPVTVVHHTTTEAPDTGSFLLLDAERGGPVAHTAVVSRVDPTRAPEGRALISSTVLGTPPADVDRAARDHLARLYGVPTRSWETLAVHHTAEAVPVTRPPHDPRRSVRLLAGLYVCGDHRDTGTVQGALHSGRRASAAVLRDLGVGPALRPDERVPRPRAA
ncbi:FAD-dependent oxidoreductase [Streptomyces sp. MJP52]|uniref:FAD-dependent oxidoreductase n=1 Tax=Streptomyces sp. MJP52 TaxID=2940555 RepID=UPI0024755036|nr:FAD-dependent oxidoreductase [Streptomyces sp. MJP52]MDH6227300.1 phytoene dehydrogenase-like protein [Streptomyces sp. MJP52]